MFQFRRAAGAACQQMRWLGRRQMSKAAHGVEKAGTKSILGRRFVAGVGFGVGVGFLYGAYERSFKYRIASDALPTLSEYVDLQPPTDTAAFPPTITVDKVAYQALGTGVRTVTFLKLHVYAAGIYIAVDDVALARKVLALSHVEHNDVDSWKQLLSDPVKGTNVIDTLLRANVRFAIRIVPTRTTGYGHLRDGFIKSIMNRPEVKALDSPGFGESINELKRAFSHHRKLQKGQVITWAREATGGMSAWYGDNDETKELLGSPSDPDVSRLFFLQYLTGTSPSSPTLKDRTMTGLSALAVTAAA